MVVLEGWLLGCPPQNKEALNQPINRLEAEDDPDIRWRALVNDKLTQYHSDLSPRLDQNWFMAFPSWSRVIDWRWQQELEAIQSGQPRYLQDRDAVSEFLAAFERIALHMRSGCKQWADIVIRIDEQHQLTMA